MNSKETFYKQLSEKLSDLGVPDEYTQRHLKQFDGYFQGKNDDEIELEIQKLGSIDRVAARIKKMTDKIIEAEHAQNEAEEQPKEQSHDTTASESEPPKRTRRKAQSKIEVDDDKPSSEEFADIKPSEREEQSDDCVVYVPSASHKAGSEEFAPVETDNDTSQNSSFSQPQILRRRGENSNRIYNTELDEEAIKNNTKKFWIIFAATLPITIFVVGITGIAFAFLFFSIAVAIIAAVALLVGIVASGTLISLLGLILGASQMLTSIPIGLYDCGLSIIVAAAAMFCGILVYNFAVRLMPFAAKWLLILFKYVVKKFKELFIYLKKECIGL